MTIWWARCAKRSRALFARIGSSKRATHSSMARLLVKIVEARVWRSTRTSEQSLDCWAVSLRRPKSSRMRRSGATQLRSSRSKELSARDWCSVCKRRATFTKRTRAPARHAL